MIWIYMIKNLVNNKVYIGSTNNLSRRWIEHKNHLNNGKHTNNSLQNDWTKYSSSSFEFSVLNVCSESERDASEQLMIDNYDSQNPKFGYNLKDAGSNGGLSEESKKKISRRQKGNILTNEIKEKISLNSTNYHPTIVKNGIRNGKQNYAIKYCGHIIKQSFNRKKLTDWLSVTDLSDMI